MIVITGAAGFIASVLVAKLNEENFIDLVLVDDFSNEQKKANYADKKFVHLVDRNSFFDWLDENEKMVQFVFHLGARTDTTEFNKSIFDELNFNFSCKMWNACINYGLPLVYASSAATYGSGEFGYDDLHELSSKLVPLNPYGESKNDFDKWALAQERKPYFWVGLKFFNVYGPNEYHKGRMASVIFHAFHQIKASGSLKLFRSHHEAYADGCQLRDFISVFDIASVCYFLMHHRKDSGIYNLGSGVARTFIDLANITFAAMNVASNISFIDTPADIRDKYQYFTCANMSKLRAIGYQTPFTTLENGILHYVTSYLIPGKYV